jgi:hypothetical protein
MVERGVPERVHEPHVDLEHVDAVDQPVDLLLRVAAHRPQTIRKKKVSRGSPCSHLSSPYILSNCGKFQNRNNHNNECSLSGELSEVVDEVGLVLGEVEEGVAVRHAVRLLPERPEPLWSL